MKKIIFLSAFLLLLFSIPTYADAAGVSRQVCVNYIISGSSIDPESADKAVLDKYTDAEEIYENNYSAFAAAVEHNIIAGYEDNTLRPNEEVTRGEFACMIYRAKDYLNSPTTSLDYNGYYTDLSDWNKEEIMYCIENGFLLGYGGTEFGSDDSITYSQIETVLTRARYGLTTLEYYALLEVIGEKSLPFQEIKASVLDERFNAPPEKESTEESSAWVSHNAGSHYKIGELTNMLTYAGCQNFEKYSNTTYVDYIKEAYMKVGPGPNYGTGGGLSKYLVTLMYDEFKSLDEIINYSIENNIKRESIPIIAENSLYMSGPGPGNMNYQCAMGYEYFKYVEGDTLPDGIELGKWYRREFSLESYMSKNFYQYVDVDFGTPEECDF